MIREVLAYVFTRDRIQRGIWSGSVTAVMFFAIIITRPRIPIPKLEDTWWGPGNASEEDTSIKPFQVGIYSQTILDLKERLTQTRPFTPPLEGLQQQYGINTNFLDEIVYFWKYKYNWRDSERFLNKISQFQTSIQGLKIHFIRVKPPEAPSVRVVPLLILHGWGSSVREFYDIIPLLTTPQKDRNFVFEVIAPSLPGFGFSDGAVRPGLGAAQMAVVLKNLMERLGFKKFYVQGGDWGGIIATIMATLYSKKVLGIHSNMCFVNIIDSDIRGVLAEFYPVTVYYDNEKDKSLDVFGDYIWGSSPEEKEKRLKRYPHGEFFLDVAMELGRFHLHALKADTLGTILKESPVALAAYILEKFTTWTNPDWKPGTDGGLTEKFTYTQLLDNIMIYWVTDSVTTSLRIYAESNHLQHRDLPLDRLPVRVPSACAKFKYEKVYFSDKVLKEKYRQLVQSNEFSVGGHFPSFEVPEILAEDIWSAVEKFEAINRQKEEL